MTTNQHLKSLREDSGLTALHVATILGCSQPNVAVIESGTRSPRVNTVAKYYAAVGRLDLADRFRPLLNGGDWAETQIVAHRHAALSPGFLADRQKHGRPGRKAANVNQRVSRRG